MINLRPEPDNTTAHPQIPLVFSAEGLQLQGTLHMPERPYPNLIVGSHGLYSSGNSPKQASLARECCRMGIAYFRFDHRGCGRSEGRFEEVTTLAGRRRDLVAAVAFLRAEFPLGDGLGLFGSSLGGATCLAAAPLLKPDRMVTLAAPVDSRSILSAASKVPPVEPLFFRDAFQFDLRDLLREISGLLVIHGQDDEVIPAGHADLIYEQVRDPKKLLSIPGGDHRLSQKADQRQFTAAALDWFRPLTQPSKAHPKSHAKH